MRRIQEFIDHLRKEYRYSEHTLAAYSKDLMDFSHFLDNEFSDTNISQAHHHMLRSWVVTLSDTEMKATSINRKISTLRSFYKYLIKIQVREDNPATLLKALKKEKKLPEFVEESQMERLFNQLGFPDDYAGLLDQTLITLLYSTGMRLSELVALKQHDIDFEKQQLKVLGKRNKERIIPLHDELVVLLKHYLSIRNSTFPQYRDIYLLLTPTGHKIYHKFVYRRINNYLSMITTLSKKSPHVIRHSFATHMMNKGADINAIKEILGHANLAATQIYTHNTIDKLKSIYKQAHPKA